MKLHRLKEIIREELLIELEFTDQSEFDSYTSAHSIRDTTKVRIGNRDTTAGEAKGKQASTGSATDSTKTTPVKRKKVISPSAPNPYFKKKYGKLNLNSYPPMGVNEKSVRINMEGNINTHAVMSWKDPKTGRNVNAYTKKFMDKNAKVKWKRVENIKPEWVDNIHKKSNRALKSRSAVTREAGAIISMISQTGLRPGSQTGYADTQNRGVSTLGPENIKIEGDRITINFIGKSYQENNAEIVDKDLANYLSTKIKEREGNEFLFDISTSQLQTQFHNNVGRKGMKIKDLRTFTATKMAKEILENNTISPPPLPQDKKQIKNLVKHKLDIVFNQVSQKLNNTPAMAKSSYVHPKVIENWLLSMGVAPVLVR